MDPFKFEDNFANVAFAGLTTLGIPHGAARQDSTELPKDRVEFSARGWVRASGQMAQSNSGAWFDNHYRGTLAWGVLTQRGGSNVANHNVWVSNIRTAMTRPAQFFNANNLPCYQVLSLHETGSDIEQVKPTDADRTDLTFIVEVGIVGSSVA